jgi:hypothetical protein
MSAPVTFLFRAGVLVTACAGITMLATTDLLTPTVAAAAVVLACLAAAAPGQFPSPAGRRLRWVAAGCLIAAGAAGAIVSAGDTAVLVDFATALTRLGRLIAPLMTGVLIAQLLVADRARDLRFALVLGCVTFLLGLGLAPRPAVVLPLLVAWPAIVTALHESRLAKLRDAADVVATSDAPGRPRRFPHLSILKLAAVSAVVAVLATVALPASDGVGARGRLTGPAGQALTYSQGRGVEAYASGVLDLRARGSLPDTPVAEVPWDSPGLWRGVVLSFYDGISWRASAGPGLGGSADVDGTPSAVRRDAVSLREGFAGVVLSPGRPLHVAVEGNVASVEGGLAIHPLADADYPTTYVVTSAVTDPPAEILRAAQGVDPTTIDVLGVPPQVPSRVRSLGQRLTAGTASRYDAVRAVEDYLRRTATYRLDSPVPPRGQDAVDHFLFDARTGFCEQFASAEAVLLRVAGIPARLVTGFSGGSDERGARLLRSSDAHAWVEVWYPGVGWVASDPTAGAELAGGGSLGARLDALLRALKRDFGVAALLAVAAIALLSFVISRRRARRLLAPRPDVLNPRSPVVAAFVRLEATLDRVGAPRAPAESLAELAGRLPSGPPIARALGVLEQVCYARRPPDVDAVQEAARVIDDVAAGLLAAQSR